MISAVLPTPVSHIMHDPGILNDLCAPSKLYFLCVPLVALGHCGETKQGDREGKGNKMKRIGEQKQGEELEERQAEPRACSELASVREIPSGALSTAQHHKPRKA